MIKVIIVASILNSSDVPFFLWKAFQESGCQARLVTVDEELPVLEQALYLNDLRSHLANLKLFSRRLLRICRDFRPNLVLVYGSNFSILPDALREIKKRFDCKIALWEGNLYFWRWFQAESLRYYDYCFVADSYFIPILKEPAGKKHVYLLPAGCDPDFHKPLALSEAERDKFGADISFVGSAHPNRVKLFESLSHYNLKLWGQGWDCFPMLRKYFNPEPVYGLKKTKVYNAAKICPNLQSTAWQINGVSCRIFEVAACGGFSICENKKDLSNFFKIGEEIVIFKSNEDLKRKIEYYLAHPDERQEIAQRAYQRVISEHTYKHRVQEILDRVSG